MKKLFIIICIIFLSSCGGNQISNNHPKDLSISGVPDVIYIGQSFNIEVTSSTIGSKLSVVYETNFQDKYIQNNISPFSISSDGVVTALEYGGGIIVVRSTYDTNVFCEKKIKVTSKEIEQALKYISDFQDYSNQLYSLSFDYLNVTNDDDALLIKDEFIDLFSLFAKTYVPGYEQLNLSGAIFEDVFELFTGTISSIDIEEFVDISYERYNDNWFTPKELDLGEDNFILYSIKLTTKNTTTLKNSYEVFLVGVNGDLCKLYRSTDIPLFKTGLDEIKYQLEDREVNMQNIVINVLNKESDFDNPLLQGTIYNYDYYQYNSRYFDGYSLYLIVDNEETFERQFVCQSFYLEYNQRYYSVIDDIYSRYEDAATYFYYEFVLKNPGTSMEEFDIVEYSHIYGNTKDEMIELINNKASFFYQGNIFLLKNVMEGYSRLYLILKDDNGNYYADSYSDSYIDISKFPLELVVRNNDYSISLLNDIDLEYGLVLINENDYTTDEKEVNSMFDAKLTIYRNIVSIDSTYEYYLDFLLYELGDSYYVVYGIFTSRAK
jgi:hypothetical protein